MSQNVGGDTVRPSTYGRSLLNPAPVKGTNWRLHFYNQTSVPSVSVSL